MAVRKRGAALFAPCSLTTSPDGITATAPGRSGATAWSALQGYGETPRHFFLMLDGASGFIVPKRDLSPDQLASFAAELAKYCKPVGGRSDEGVSTWSTFRTALLVFALLTLVFLAWHAARGQQRSHGAAQQGDEADER